MLSIVPLIRVERIPRVLVRDRRRVRRRGVEGLASIVGLVGVVVAGLLACGRFAGHPTCAVHWGHAALAAAARVVAAAWC